MAMETQNTRVIHLLPQQYMQSTENVMDRSKESLFPPLHGAQELNTYEHAIEYTVHLGERKVMNPNPKRKINLRGLKTIEWQDPLKK